mgnify:CR=1 FL=1
MIFYKNCHICATNYRHPDITTGQHTNGAAMIWIRAGNDAEWTKTRETQMHKVRRSIDELGANAYINLLRGTDG